MKSSIGTRLREQRERQQVDLTAIAAQTKIKVAFLDALENDDVANWPKGIFGRAYLRDYARAIGLDPEPLVREFYELHPDPVGPVPPHPDPEEEAAAGNHSTPFRRFVTSAFSVVPSLLRSSKPDPAMAAIAAASSTPRILYDPALADDLEMASSAATTDGRDGEESALIDGTLDGVGAAAEPSIPNDVIYAGTAAVEEARADTASAPVSVRTHVDETTSQTMPAAADTVTLSTAAMLCTRLARARDWRDVDAVLGGAAHALDAVGLIVWSWDPRANVLRPALAQGYAPAVLARLPAVRIDEDHALAAAFRAVDTQVVEGGPGVHGAVVVPLLAPRGCVGVFALELRAGRELEDAVRAFAALLAAQLVTLIDVTTLPEAVSA